MNKRTWVVSILLLLNGLELAAQAPDISILNVKAPEKFKAVFITTKGNFVIEAYRKWSPLGVDRLYQLISSGFYNNALLFRVEPNYVVQFGVSESRKANLFWDRKKIPDEPLVQKNTKGTLSFARDGLNDRCTQLFINMVDNPILDTALRKGVKGYPPIARVVKGMDIIAKLNARYAKKPLAIQDSLYRFGNPYFEKKFPGLDKILTATILP